MSAILKKIIIIIITVTAIIVLSDLKLISTDSLCQWSFTEQVLTELKWPVMCWVQTD